jgi:hypothetical protein
VWRQYTPASTRKPQAPQSRSGSANTYSALPFAG